MTNDLVESLRQETPFEVGLEGVQFTFVDVHEGYDEAFNRWYESDHFYAGGTMVPFVLAGRRWYASKDQRDARYVGPRCPFPEPHRGTNLALYWLTVGGIDGFRDWIGPQLVELRGRGRMFSERTHINTGAYRFRRSIDRPGSSSVPPHVALDHPFGGMLAVFATEGLVSAGSQLLPDGALLLSFDREVVTLDSKQLGITPGLAQADLSVVDPVTLLLLFLRDPAPTSARDVAALTGAVCASAGLEALWGGTFSAVVPGSNEHIAEMR